MRVQDDGWKMGSLRISVQIPSVTAVKLSGAP
jgi:hypothetical protein